MTGRFGLKKSHYVRPLHARLDLRDSPERGCGNSRLDRWLFLRWQDNVPIKSSCETRTLAMEAID